MLIVFVDDFDVRFFSEGHGAREDLLFNSPPVLASVCLNFFSDRIPRIRTEGIGQGLSRCKTAPRCELEAAEASDDTEVVPPNWTGAYRGTRGWALRHVPSRGGLKSKEASRAAALERRRRNYLAWADWRGGWSSVSLPC